QKVPREASVACRAGTLLPKACLASAAAVVRDAVAADAANAAVARLACRAKVATRALVAHAVTRHEASRTRRITLLVQRVQQVATGAAHAGGGTAHAGRAVVAAVEAQVAGLVRAARAGADAGVAVEEEG